MKRLIFILPVAGFVVIAFFLFRSLFQSSDYVPSVLIDKPAPHVNAVAMDQATPAFSNSDLASGHVTVVNFFASWCVPCHLENAQMMTLSQMPGISLYGVDYEEHQAGAGRAFLAQAGNPFSRIVSDGDGKDGVEWGVFLVPETYVVDGKGVIRFKLKGLLTQQTMTEQLLPAIEKAKLAS